MTNPVLSIVVVNWNTRDLVHNCLRSLEPDQAGYQVIVVDNGSTDGSIEVLMREFPGVRFISNAENQGFARANNQGIRASDGQYVLLLNSDAVALQTALDGLVQFMDEHPDAGACGPRLLRPDGTPQPYAFGGDPTLAYLLARGFYQLILRRFLHDWATDRVQTVDWVSGACLMVRQSAVQAVDLLDENMFMYFEDNDWCLRMRRAGWQVYYNPQVEVVHLGGQSLAKNPQAQQAYYRSLEYFYAKHYGVIARWVLKVALGVYRWLRSLR